MKRYALLLVLTCGFMQGCTASIQEVPVMPRAGEPRDFSVNFTNAAIRQINAAVRYDSHYRELEFPGGDVPSHLGVCTDVVIRSYRALGIDLQVAVHEDMTTNFTAYASHQRWGLTEPDSNIDHRRVPNLQVFFNRKGIELPVTDNPQDYVPGDIVTWNVDRRPHIGIIVNRKQDDHAHFMVVHNMGRGQVLEDILFKYPITGHYRYYGEQAG